MINDANIDLAGFIASEPSFKRLDSGTSTAKLRVAYTERRFNRETGEWGDGPTSFVTVLCWRTLADNVAVCLRKGEPVLVRGRLRIREYQDKEGSPRSVTEVEASSVGHDLSRGVAHFSRTRRAPGETAAESTEAQAAAPPRDGEESADRYEPGLPGEPAGERAAGDVGTGENGPGENGPGENGPRENGPRENGPRENGPRENGTGESGTGRKGRGKGTGGKDAGGNGAGVLDDGAVAGFASQMAGSPDGNSG
jgi:single-strand DNA-binding protein